MISSALFDLPDLSLRALVSSLTGGAMQRGVSASVIHSIVGGASAGIVDALREFEARGFTTAQLALLLETILVERARHARPESVLELVLSGPEVASVPMQDTAAVMQSLVNGAEREILLVGYAVHDGRTIFRGVAERMEALPDIAVTLCLDIHRGSDATVSPLLVHRFAETFRQRHWPGRRLPELYYFPPALELDHADRASLHAKCVVVDRGRALVTSANFTEAAQQRNIELGLLVQHAPTVARITDYFDGLCTSGALVRCNIGAG